MTMMMVMMMKVVINVMLVIVRYRLLLSVLYFNSFCQTLFHCYQTIFIIHSFKSLCHIFRRKCAPWSKQDLNEGSIDPIDPATNPIILRNRRRKAINHNVCYKQIIECSARLALRLGLASGESVCDRAKRRCCCLSSRSNLRLCL